MEELEHRVLVLEQAASRLQLVEHLASAKKGPKPPRKPPPPVAVVVGRVKALPGNLDAAERAITRVMAVPTPAPPARADASP
jgi:hypothetical protein